MKRRITEHEGRAAFGFDADAYHTARPAYPEAIYAVLAASGATAPGASILEIGAGSGIATGRLLETGAIVSALEPDTRFLPRLAALAAGFPPRLRVIEAGLEEADLPEHGYDLVACATSYHWLDPRQRLARIRRTLRPGGWVALWWNVFQDLERHDRYHEATAELLADLDASPSGAVDELPFALRRAERIDELRSAGFELVCYQESRWTLMLDPAGTARLYATFAAIQRLPDDRRAELLERLQEIAVVRFGGVVERHMTSPLYLFRDPSEGQERS